MGVVSFMAPIHQQRLVSGVIAGRLDQVKAALLAGASPNQADSLGDTPVLWAAALGELPIFHALVDAGGLPDQVNAQGDTIYHAAMRQGKVAFLVATLTPSVDPERPNARGETLWSLALGQLHPAAVRCLVTYAGRPHWTAAQAAQRLTEGLCHSEEALEAVLAHGAAIGWDHPNVLGNRPWDLLRAYPKLVERYRPQGAPVVAWRARNRPT